MKMLIKNIRELVQVEEAPVTMKAGKEMAELKTIKNAWLAIENGDIVAFGEMKNWAGITDWTDLEVIDAEGKMVFPCWCDSHTHLVFAASREGEFVDRIKGLSYQEIAAKGGGILNSAKKLANTPEEELLASTEKRLQQVIKTGTGAIEIKSGYGLSLEAELKMLRVIKQLKEKTAVAIKATFLGAHAIPAEYKEKREDYIKLIIDKMLPAIAEEQLADYIDAFCETNYFTPEETEAIMKAGAKHGLRPKIHVNQFTAIGGVQAGIKHNALSVDHLEVMRPEDIEALKGTETMPTVLPSCSFFLNIPYAPAREMIDAGLPLALATDYNPGSTPSGNMNFVAALGCIRLRMTPEEVINACTINSAYAMGVEATHGSIAVGKKANIFITDPIPSLAYLPYSFGTNLVETVIIDGKVVHSAN